MKRIFHIALSLWLSLLLLFGSTAKEFIHLFAGHQDTIHRHIDGEGLVIESKHHHCSFLSDSLPAFVGHSIGLPVVFTRQAYVIRHFSLYRVFYRAQSILPCFRGPPAV